MKTILFLLVLVGITIVENTEASKKEIKKDVSFDKGERMPVDKAKSAGNMKDKFYFKKYSNRIGDLTGIIPGNNPPAIVSVSDILKGFRNLSLDDFFHCTERKLGANLEKCYRGLELLGLNVSSIVMFLDDKLLGGTIRRENECDSCNLDDWKTGFLNLSQECELLDNITNYLACVFDQLKNFDCIDYINSSLRSLESCLADFLDRFYNDPNYECRNLYDDLERVLQLLGSIIITLLGGTVSNPEIPEFCIKIDK
ncbi:uncharacterized protein LOC111630950 [Centruroides sculpturatus]|uniref:uncharacterized protein LOC111630950 n=1 Tax=Centruroides sculpturatus TaxID=218467 RepID=UPI000C6D3249|nr:uncharacterized protein LOC111630950 [Centruroides sculpturatus]